MLDSDYAFHWDGGGDEFTHLRVVKFEIHDAMSAPYEAKLLLHARLEDDDIDPYDLVGKLGTLRITTGSKPGVRPYHGLIVAAEDRGASGVGRLYEVTMMPPLARAMHRKRSRIFFEKTLQQIIEAVLTGDPRMTSGDGDGTPPEDLRDAFVVPEEKFVWRLSETARLEDEKARPHCVQYNETDFDFVSRLLEEEGISYHFEHTAKQIVFVMSDTDAGRPKLDPFDALGADVLGRNLDDLRMGARLRPTKVKLVEYNWQKPKLDMGREKKADADDLFVEKYPGRFHEGPDQGDALVQARLDRFHTEARVATATGSCRLLGAGSVFAYQSATSRLEGEYLVTKARLRGVAEGALGPGAAQLERLPNGGPFHAELELARRGTGKSAQESRFRPARKTEKPRIHGTQTATVVDDPTSRGAEIHVGGPSGNENGCVRLKFHWDTETARHEKEPTSMWVRVSQIFAGAGGGSVAHPRVGTEVIVSYEDGDPDRPIVVGRVYNGIQPSAALGKGAATISTMKSLSSPGGKVFNEFQFDDTADDEKVNLTAGRNWNSQVNHQRHENIGHDSTSGVGANRTEKTKGNRETTVDGSNTETVSSGESVTVTGGQTIDVSGGQTVTISGGQSVSVTGHQTIDVSAARSLSTGAANTISVGAGEEHSIAAGHTLSVGSSQTISVGGAKTETIAAVYALSVGSVMSVNAGASHIVDTPMATTTAGVITDNAGVWTANASAAATVHGGSVKAIADGEMNVHGATVTISSGGIVSISGAVVKISGGAITIAAEGGLTLSGAKVDIKGGVVNVN